MPTGQPDPSANNKLMNLPASQLAWAGPDLLLQEDNIHYVSVAPGTSVARQMQFFWWVLMHYPHIDGLMFRPIGRSIMTATPAPIPPV